MKSNIELLPDCGNIDKGYFHYLINNDFFLFCHKDKKICIRKEGNIILNKNWSRLNKETLKYLKLFLGGMYLSEVKLGIKQKEIKVLDLN